MRYFEPLSGPTQHILTHAHAHAHAHDVHPHAPDGRAHAHGLTSRPRMDLHPTTAIAAGVSDAELRAAEREVNKFPTRDGSKIYVDGKPMGPKRDQAPEEQQQR